MECSVIVIVSVFKTGCFERSENILMDTLAKCSQTLFLLKAVEGNKDTRAQR